MNLRREIRFGVGVVLVLEVFTLLVAVGLLSRMSPAITLILSENEYTIEAVQDMTTALIPDIGTEQERLAAFEDHLARASKNVTESEEAPLIETLERRYEDAVRGEREARREVLEALTELEAVNRASMREADAKAHRLGQTGAWVAALLGLLTAAASFFSVRRLERKIRGPVEEVSSTVIGVETGDVHRRCLVAGNAPAELRELGERINFLLEERSAKAKNSWEASAALDRAISLFLVDREPGAVLVFEGVQEVVLSNERGTRLLLEHPELRHELATGHEPAELEVERADISARLRLVVVHNPPEVAEVEHEVAEGAVEAEDDASESLPEASGVSE